ncbi:hypothetical protein RRG08_036056 [Elysia crispata]|uniref:Uncharacterized protein n=1 Tax=Elysia crispata TaxID=231223 RepID=A0AAE1E1V2_9GAST|nr:hypothetical protein RRG08_036056 [Elysia crispata]
MNGLDPRGKADERGDKTETTRPLQPRHYSISRRSTSTAVKERPQGGRVQTSRASRVLLACGKVQIGAHLDLVSKMEKWGRCGGGEEEAERGVVRAVFSVDAVGKAKPLTYELVVDEVLTLPLFASPREATRIVQ